MKGELLPFAIMYSFCYSVPASKIHEQCYSEKAKR